MSAVAVRESISPSRINRKVPPASGFRKAPRRRPNNNLIRKVCRIVAAASAIIALAYIATHAAITALSYRNVDLSSLCRTQEIENERLRVAITRYLSPEQIAASAEKSGMICANNYEYLRAPQSVASAR